MHKANKALHRTPHVVTLFAKKTRKKARQHAPLGECGVKCHEWDRQQNT